MLAYTFKDKSTIEARFRDSARTLQKSPEQRAKIYLFSFPCYETEKKSDDKLFSWMTKSASIGFLVDPGGDYFVFGHGYETSVGKSIKIALRDMKIGYCCYDFITKVDIVEIIDSQYIKSLSEQVRLYKPTKQDFKNACLEIFWKQ